MNAKERVLLLIGSAKRSKSTSASLGTYLLERMREVGFDTETLLIHQALKSKESCEALLAATDHADIIIVASPLYVDSLPYMVTKALEIIAKHRNAKTGLKQQRLLAILNCGFPEAHHNETAIAICRRFAKEAGLEWAGGLALGGGESLNGQPLLKARRMTRNVVKSLDLTAKALLENKPAPEEAVALMAKPLVATWVYILIGEFGWKRRAKRHGMRKKLHARPYQL